MSYRNEILSKCRDNVFSDTETKTHTEPYEGMFIDPVIRDVIELICKKK